MKNIGIHQTFRDFSIKCDLSLSNFSLIYNFFIFSEGDKKKNDVEVKIDKFDKKDKKKTLCRLEIKKVWVSSFMVACS